MNQLKDCKNQWHCIRIRPCRKFNSNLRMIRGSHPTLMKVLMSKGEPKSPCQRKNQSTPQPLLSTKENIAASFWTRIFSLRLFVKILIMTRLRLIWWRTTRMNHFLGQSTCRKLSWKIRKMSVRMSFSQCLISEQVKLKIWITMRWWEFWMMWMKLIKKCQSLSIFRR